MKVLVTGGAGLIGRHLINRLLNRGISVRVFDLPGMMSNSPSNRDVEVIEGDIRDHRAVESAVRDCDLVYHLAARTDGSMPTWKVLREVNVQGTENVSNAVLKLHAGRLIYTSSVAVHGRRVRSHGINEESPICADSPYSRSKLLAEQLLRAHRKKYDLPIVIARTANVFGPGVMDWRELFQLVAASGFRFYGKGEGLLQLTSTDDIAEGLCLCGVTQGIEGKTYVLTGGNTISLRQWIGLIQQEVGGSIRTPSVPGVSLRIFNLLNSITYTLVKRELPKSDRLNLFLGDRSFDISKARKDLGYEPKVSPREIVHATAEWYRSQGYLDLSAN